MIKIYTRKLLKSWQAGRCLGPIVIIDPAFKNKPIEAHEEIHYGQWKSHPLTHFFKYKYCDEYRLKCEVEAYREQIKHGAVSYHCARYLSQYYNLNISFTDAIKILK